MRLICVANAIVDVTVAVEAFPEPGGDTIARQGSLRTGGAGFNVMVAARRLGVACAYAGAHGTGPFGDQVRAAMAREAIEVCHEPVRDADTGWDIAITDASTERTFITVPGAEALLTADSLATVIPQTDDVIYISGYALLAEPQRTAVCEWLAQLPRETVVVTDPGPLVSQISRETLDVVLPRTTWWSANTREAHALTGRHDAAAAAAELTKFGCGVLVRCGADGCVVAEPGGQPKRIPGFAVEAIDSNGAGDTHVGSFIASLMAGLDLNRSALRANAAAAYSVTVSGPATGPTRLELERFMAARAVK